MWSDYMAFKKKRFTHEQSVANGIASNAPKVQSNSYYLLSESIKTKIIDNCIYGNNSQDNIEYYSDIIDIYYEGYVRDFVLDFASFKDDYFIILFNDIYEYRSKMEIQNKKLMLDCEHVTEIINELIISRHKGQEIRGSKSEISTTVNYESIPTVQDIVATFTPIVNAIKPNKGYVKVKSVNNINGSYEYTADIFMIPHNTASERESYVTKAQKEKMTPEFKRKIESKYPKTKFKW